MTNFGFYFQIQVVLQLINVFSISILSLCSKEGSASEETNFCFKDEKQGRLKNERDDVHAWNILLNAFKA